MYLQTTGCKENFTLSLGIYLFRQLVRKVFLYAPCSFSLIFRKPLKFRRFCIDWYNQQFTQYNSSGFQSKTQPNFRSRMNLTQNLYTNSIICFVHYRKCFLIFEVKKYLPWNTRVCCSQASKNMYLDSCFRYFVLPSNKFCEISRQKARLRQLLHLTLNQLFVIKQPLYKSF